ncbi:MAG: glycosyltransferase [Elusimicrobia bacterium]|nr:glycosyltransferase [Elusimicrobiota bacterium]
MLAWIELIFIGLAAYVVLQILYYLACMICNLNFYRVEAPRQETEPFTIIKPMKEGQEQLEENLRSLIEADTENRLQVLFAIETKEDPAYPIACNVVGSYPKRDLKIVLTGPSRDRMGKIHNMIEAFPHVKHSRVVFSDADIKADRRLLVETSKNFKTGADAIYATPYVFNVDSIGQLLMAGAFNHGFSVFGALMFRLGMFQSFSGGWMGFKKEMLQKIGGLEGFSHYIAEDYAIGSALRRAGARISLLRTPAWIREDVSSLQSAMRHFHKWTKVICNAAPSLYGFVLAHCSLFLTFCALAMSLALVQGTYWGLGLWGTWVLVRIAGSLLQDRAILGAALPWTLYLCIPLIDIMQAIIWYGGLFSKTVTWRGKKYRVFRGGKVRVISG